ncbi:hypothetical protein Taro_029151 [Colocasia esculenta]|uniref:Uncharacterized protein n=1 Tax=Colocasia esculenta TaxID=4460 RepID=A0A843VZG8_COLES|nr:hypothetical protein [Colocasia esculenta]
MSSSNHAPQRYGKAPASPVPPSPLVPPALPFPKTYSPDYWNCFYVGWTMALQKASRLYHHKGLTNILPDIGPRAEHICSSPSSLFCGLVCALYDACTVILTGSSEL